MTGSLRTLAGTILAVGAFALAAPTLAHADSVYLADYWGFSWEDLTGGQPLAPGNAYHVAGEIDQLGAPLTGDLSANEYTIWIDGLVQQGSAALIGSGVDVIRGAYTVYRIDYGSAGSLSIYEDPSRNHTYAPNPANATVPSTFTDGTLYLGGTLSYFAVSLTRYSNGDENGSYEALITFNTGTHLGQLPSYDGYTFAGMTKNRYVGIPAGWKERVDGQTFMMVTPVRPTTWGSIKSMYNR